MQADPTTHQPGGDDPAFASPAPGSGPQPCGNGEHPGTDAARDLLGYLGESREYFAHFVAAKVDSVKLSLRKAGVYAALGVVGSLAGAAVVVTTMVLLLVGLGQGLARLYGTGDWLGYITVGVLVPAIIGLGIYVGASRMMRSSRKRTMEKYEQRQQGQRARFGRAAAERAARAAVAQAGK